MRKTAVMYKKVLIIILALAFVASLAINVYWYSSSNRKLEHFTHQQYNQVLSHYESAILSTSQFILSELESSMATKKLSREEILNLYMCYEKVNQDQIQYAYYVQSYTSPDGKEAIDLKLDEPITLNYAPGLVYFNMSRALFKELLMQNGEVVVTNELEQRLKLATEIIQLNTAMYEKYIDADFDPLSDEAIVTRLKLQKDLTTTAAKLTELDGELSRLAN